MKSKEELKKEKEELEILIIVFDESEHLRGTDFEAYLSRLGKSDLGKQVEIEEEIKVDKKATKEQLEFEEASSSGYKGTFQEFKKLNRK